MIPHDSNCTTTKRKVCLGPGTKIQVTGKLFCRKIGLPICFTDLLGFLRRFFFWGGGGQRPVVCLPDCSCPAVRKERLKVPHRTGGQHRNPIETLLAFKIVVSKPCKLCKVRCQENNVLKDTCSPESTDWGADDEVFEEWRLKNELGRAERTHKLQTAP